MQPENFCYWLQGFFEIVQHIDHREGLPAEAVEEIKNHLALVFKKETPKIGIMHEGEQEQIMPIKIEPFNPRRYDFVDTPFVQGPTCVSDTRGMQLGVLQSTDMRTAAVC